MGSLLMNIALSLVHCPLLSIPCILQCFGCDEMKHVAHMCCFSSCASSSQFIGLWLILKKWCFRAQTFQASSRSPARALLLGVMDLGLSRLHAGPRPSHGMCTGVGKGMATHKHNSIVHRLKPNRVGAQGLVRVRSGARKKERLLSSLSAAAAAAAAPPGVQVPVTVGFLCLLPAILWSASWYVFSCVCVC